MLRFQVDDPFNTDRLNDVGDYHPEWDVPTLGKAFTAAFSAAVDAVRASPEPSPGRKVHAFLGPAGYGKTHLLGRINHAQKERVYFAFIPALSGIDSEEELESILRWRVVESLLYSADSFAPLRVQLAKLFAPSFAAYFAKLPAGWREKSDDIQTRLKDDPITVLEVFGKVDGLGPYHLLADALRAKLPHCSGSVLRALVLGASPAADDARWWLRGEADQVPEARLVAANLVDRDKRPLPSPPLIEILRAVAEVLRLTKTPLVVCFDQLEELFKHDRSGFSALTGHLMSWLQTVPNLLIGIGCLNATWKEMRSAAAFKSFSDRVVDHDLPPLSGHEAVELVRRRVMTWTDSDPKKGDGWPFDLDSVRSYAEKHEPGPRYFIQGECARAFADWLGNKKAGLIKLPFGGVVRPEELLKEEWAKGLEKVTGEKKPAADVQAADLWAGVREALAVAQQLPALPDGRRISAAHEQPLQTPSVAVPKHSVRLILAGGAELSVIVAVCKNDGGVGFGQWHAALDEAMKGDTAAVVVWPRAKLTVGGGAASFVAYNQKVTTGRVRPFPLDVEVSTFHQLETLRRIVLAAKTGNLLLGRETVDEKRCRELIVSAGLLANLKLFDFVFKDWPGVTAPPAPSALPPPPAVVPPPPVAAVPAAAVPPAPTSPPAVTTGKPTFKIASSVFGNLPTPTKVTTAPVAPAPAGAQLTAQPQPVSPPPPPVVLPAPAEPALPEWVEVMLKKAADYLKKKGQTVHPAGAVVGPTFVRLNMEPRGDTDVSKVRREAENLKVQLALEHEPLILSQPRYISIDVQRPDRQTVYLPPLLANGPAKFAGEPAFPVGVGVAGNAEWLNLSEPEGCHLLVAGTTGSGKSEFLKAVLASLAARLTPEQVKFRLIDPKRVTFNVPDTCPYLGGPVVYDGEEALPVLEQCVEEMERRYKLLQQRGVDHVRHLTGADAVPRWVVAMDEFADLMTDKSTKKELEPLLKRLGAKARAAGIHLILGTQRPDASVVTPVLRANLPGKIGLMVGSERESKLFLDEPDAAYLFGKGDLVWKRGGGLVRLQSPFVPQAEFLRHLRAG